MQTTNDTTKPQTEPKQEAGEGCSGATCSASSPRLLILRKSLEKKENEQSRKLEEHFADVKRANGQPLNDKRNGAATLNRWEKQNAALRNQEQSIERTKAAIEREEMKISRVASVDIPKAIRDAIDAGEITQWRKHPRMFFVVGVDRGRIAWDEETKTLGHRYLSEVPKEQYPIFRDAYNKLRRLISLPNTALTGAEGVPCSGLVGTEHPRPMLCFQHGGSEACEAENGKHGFTRPKCSNAGSNEPSLCRHCGSAERLIDGQTKCSACEITDMRLGSGLSAAGKTRLTQFARRCRSNAGLPNDGGAGNPPAVRAEAARLQRG